VQLTLTTFFVGMTLGQLIGPAIIVDLATGARLVRVLNVIAGVGGVAPIAGPLLGAVILQLSHWRMSFWTVAALSVAMLIAVLIAVPESLPPDQRHSGGLRAVAGRQVVANRRYVGYLLVTGSAMAALFAYVATSAFVLQSMNGMSPIAYSADFAANAAGMTVAALIAARLAGRVATRKVILAGQVAAGTIAPIAGLGGGHTAVPMTLIMVGGAALSMVGLLVLARGGTEPEIAPG
jgi:DHA1 family bicyclomycin/chloramphenicol resistance-like MFS transporter